MVQRVLIVESVSDIGGAERVLLDTVARLDQRRWQARLLLLSAPGALSREVAGHASVAHQPTGRYRDPRAVAAAIRRCSREIARGGATVVHANGAKAHLVAGLAGLARRRPRVWHVHDMLNPRSPLDWLALRVPATRCIAVSWAVRERLVQLGMPAARIRVVYPGLPAGRFEPGPAADTGQAVRRELGIPAEAPVVASIGRLQPWKGQHVLLTAAPAILARCPTTRFLIAGDALFGLDDDYPARLKRLAARLGIGERVHFLGHRADVPALLQAATVVAHTSVRPEAFGLTVLEGMAAGKAVVATRPGGPAELLSDGETGLLVPPDEPAALAGAIVRLLDDTALRERLGAAARRAARTRFTADRAAGQVQDLWDELAMPSQDGAVPSRGALTFDA